MSETFKKSLNDEEKNIYFRHDICCVLGFQDSEVKRLSKACI